MLKAGRQFKAKGGWKDATGWEFELKLTVVKLDGENAEAETDWVLQAVPGTSALVLPLFMSSRTSASNRAPLNSVGRCV